jgi:putative endopeptidase
MRYLLSLSCSALLACGGSMPAQPAPATAAAPAAPEAQQVSLAEVGLDATKLDRTAKPCDDFYRFACGAWLDRTAIPPDQPQYGTFNLIHDRNEALLHDILEHAAKEPGDDPVLQKLGAYYTSCMDEAAVESAGVTALAPLMAAIANVKDTASLWRTLAELHRDGVDGLFAISPGPDKKDATHMIAQITQAGLGLPDRDYYTNTDKRTLELQKAYKAHAKNMFVLNGRTPADAEKAAADSFELEHAIAESQKTRVELRDEQGTYNRVDRAGLQKLAPVAWDGYFETLGFPAIATINTVSVPYVAAFAKLTKDMPMAKWRNYLELRVLESAAPFLPKRFVDESFAMVKLLTGQQEQRPRWKRCISYADASLGELLAQPFVAAAFGGDSKQGAQRTADGIAGAFAANLPSVGWMDDPTRERARTKLQKMTRLIGYPDHWRTYDYAIDRKNFAATELAASQFESGFQLARIGKPVDKGIWQMTPPTVNAYYDPQLNEMVFPAGILQPPFFDVKSGVAVNFGAVGMIVGHELTHGFDDQGSQYDGDGNMSGWWPPHVTEAFGLRTGCVADYYARYEPLPGLHLNGKLTLGENIADMGGVKLAFAAYRAARAGAKPIVADGFNEDQQFFLAVAQAWCTKTSDELERLRTLTNPHSSPRFRVLGSLSNLPEFGDAFACSAGTTMRPERTCKVW